MKISESDFEKYFRMYYDEPFTENEIKSIRKVTSIIHMENSKILTFDEIIYKKEDNWFLIVTLDGPFRVDGLNNVINFFKNGN